jgi:hypothetical protein
LVSQTGLGSSLSGALQINQHMPGYNINICGSLGYQLSPVGELSSTSVTVDGFKLWNYHAVTGYSHIVMSNSDQVFFNLTKPVGAYSLGLSNSYSTGGVYAINLTFQMGIGRKPRSGNWITEHRPIADYGSLSVRTFLDENGNGKFDATEKGLKNVKVRINGDTVPRKSDAQGVTYLVGLQPYRNTDVDIAVETLDDPLWQPGIKGKRVRPRPGYTNMVDGIDINLEKASTSKITIVK